MQIAHSLKTREHRVCSTAKQHRFGPCARAFLSLDPQRQLRSIRQRASKYDGRIARAEERTPRDQFVFGIGGEGEFLPARCRGTRGDERDKSSRARRQRPPDSRARRGLEARRDDAIAEPQWTAIERAIGREAIRRIAVRRRIDTRGLERIERREARA